jgi:hypothetical protein
MHEIVSIQIKRGHIMAESEYKENAAGIGGINAGGDVNMGDISGQVAIGNNNTQNQTTYISIGQNDLEELKKSLLDFQNGISSLCLPMNYQNVVTGEISAAILEAEKEKPEVSKIKEKFKSAISTVKDAEKTIQDISELYEPAKKVAKLVGLAVPFL